MKRGVIILLIFLFLIIIGMTLLYFLYEKPKQIELNNSIAYFSIYANEENSEKNIVTGYRIYVNDFLWKEGQTLEGGAVEVNIPANSTFVISNFNINNQTYYFDIKNKDSFGSIPKRVNLKLISSGNLSIKRTGEINGSNLNINISSDGYFKDLHLCQKWGVHMIYSKILSNYTLNIVDKPSIYRNYDRCYSTGISLNKNNSFYFDIEYKYFDRLNEQDYVKMVFYDKDCILQNCNSTKEYKEEFLFKKS